MRLPIDTKGLRFRAVAPAERLMRFEEGKPREAWQPRADRETGEILYAVQLVVMGSGEAEVIRVTVAGEPKVQEDQAVEIQGLTALPWEMEGRSGVSFRAEQIRVQGVAPPKPAA